MKRDSIKVSVILPVYNVAPYIGKCIESLRSQTLRELEFIFVGDKSPDESMDIVERAAKEDLRIRILYNEENLGPGPSRNRGIEASCGEYLSFIDPDDYVERDYFETLYRFATEKDADIVKAHVTAVDPDGNKSSSWYDFHRGILSRMEKGEPMILYNFVEHFSEFFKASLVRDDPEVRYADTKAGEDSVFLLTVSLKDPTFYLCDDTEYYHLIRKDSLEGNVSFESCLEGLKALEKRIDVLKTHSFPKAWDTYLNRTISYYINRFLQLDKAQKDPEIRQRHREIFTDKLERELSRVPDAKAITRNNRAYAELLTLTAENQKESRTVRSDHPMVSIILPMYKCADFADDAVKMVRRQTFQDTEIICVLDGPDRELRSIIESHAKEDDRVILLECEHRGAGAARNSGIDLSSGKYLLFLDADDLFSPNFVETLVSKAEEKTADIVMCTYTQENFWLNKTDHHIGFDLNRFPEGRPIDPATIDDFYHGFNQAPWNKLFLRSMIEARRLRFSTTTITNDVFFVVAAMTCAKRLVTVNEDLLTVRRYVNEHSLSSNRAKHLQDIVAVLQELRRWLKEEGLWKTYRDTYCSLYRDDIHYQAKYAYNDLFVDKVAEDLSRKDPWRRMSRGELIDRLDFRIGKLTRRRDWLADQIAVLKNADNRGRIQDLRMTKNQIRHLRQIKKTMKTKYGRDLEKRSNPLRAMLWVLRSKGWKSIWQSTGRMRKKEVCLNLTGVICAGHLTTARCAIIFFLPMDVSDKDVVVEELAVVVRSNGYYPACVSGEQGDTLTLMGPSLTRIWAGDSSIRKNEVRRVVAETVPGVGVRIRVVFFHPLAKDSKGTPADNNQPLSVSVNGRLRLK